MKTLAAAIFTISTLALPVLAGEFDSQYFDSPEEKYEASKTEEFRNFTDSVATAYCETAHTLYYMEHYKLLQYNADDYAKKALTELQSLSAVNNSSMPTEPFLKKHYSGAIVQELIETKKLSKEMYDYVASLNIYIGHVSKVDNQFVAKIKANLKHVINFYNLEEIYSRTKSCDEGHFDE
jgi:hypothetical protein